MREAKKWVGENQAIIGWFKCRWYAWAYNERPDGRLDIMAFVKENYVQSPIDRSKWSVLVLLITSPPPPSYAPSLRKRALPSPPPSLGSDLERGSAGARDLERTAQRAAGGRVNGECWPIRSPSSANAIALLVLVLASETLSHTRP